MSYRCFSILVGFYLELLILLLATLTTPSSIVRRWCLSSQLVFFLYWAFNVTAVLFEVLFFLFGGDLKSVRFMAQYVLNHSFSKIFFNFLMNRALIVDIGLGITLLILRLLALLFLTLEQFDVSHVILRAAAVSIIDCIISSCKSVKLRSVCCP